MKLTPKAKVFLQTMVKIGYNQAIRLTSLSRQQVWNILHSKEGLSYTMDQLREHLNNIGLSTESLVKEYYEFIKSKYANGRDKADGYKFLINLSREAERETDGKNEYLSKYLDKSKHFRLTPSKEVFSQTTDNIEDIEVNEG